MYLKEIQGFRVVAALLVAVYHIWFHRVSGGVDAFFVIAGFFLFQGFLRRPALHFGDVVTYWQRTLARIVPSAGVVILATCALFAFFGTEIHAERRIKDAVTALMFVENWWLAHVGDDYLSIGETPSPFQQLWALSVQAQIYFLLPPVVYLIFRSLRRRDRFAAAPKIFGALLLLGFAFALWRTHQDQPKAYFNTFARMWEFLTGGLLALILHRLVMRPLAAKVLGYTCLVVLVGFAGVISVAEAFPGLPTLIPVLATCGIIIAARNQAGMAVLNNRVMQSLGNLSFTFYMWHWPIYLFYWDYTGGPEVSFAGGLVILAVALVLAAVTYHFFETPFRNLKAVRGGLARAVITCALALVPATALTLAWGGQNRMDQQQARADLKAVAEGAPASRLVPALPFAKNDVPVSYNDGCYQKDFDSDTLVSCSYGNPEGTQVVALVGGSHALQWLPALRKIAGLHPEMRIVNMAKSGCTFTTSLEGFGTDSNPEACLSWSRKALAAVQKLKPDLVITTASRVDDAGQEIVPPGYIGIWKALGEDQPVLAIRDNPRSANDIADCVDRRGPGAAECQPVLPQIEGGAFPPGTFSGHVKLVDFTAEICPQGVCAAVRNNILLYRDANHLTATAARLMAPELEQAIYPGGTSLSALKPG